MSLGVTYKSRESEIMGAFRQGIPCGSDSKESTCNVGDLGLNPGWGDVLEKGMATHSSILA